MSDSSASFRTARGIFRKTRKQIFRSNLLTAISVVAMINRTRVVFSAVLARSKSKGFNVVVYRLSHYLFNTQNDECAKIGLMYVYNE